MSDPDVQPRGLAWDVAEHAYAALMAAFQRYDVAIGRTGTRTDSVIGLHIAEARYHLRHARP